MDCESGTVTMKDGRNLKGDVLIGADGVKVSFHPVPRAKIDITSQLLGNSSLVHPPRLFSLCLMLHSGLQSMSLEHLSQ